MVSRNSWKASNPHKASGPDEFHVTVVKELSSYLDPVLSNLFQSSLGTGEVLADWWKSNINPMFEKEESIWHPTVDLYPSFPLSTNPLKRKLHTVWSPTWLPRLSLMWNPIPVSVQWPRLIPQLQSSHWLHHHEFCQRIWQNVAQALGPKVAPLWHQMPHSSVDSDFQCKSKSKKTLFKVGQSETM